MTISSNSTSMQSLAITYTLGLTAGGAINLLVRDPSSDIKQEIMYTLWSVLGALTMGIFWKYIHNKDEKDSISSPGKVHTTISVNDTKATDQLVIPIIVSTLGLTPEKVLRLISDQSLPLNNREIYGLGAGVGILAMSRVWKYIDTERITENKSSSAKLFIKNVTERNSKPDKLTVPIIFALGMLGGIKLGCKSSFSGFIRGSGILGITLYARNKEKRGTLNWKDF